MRVLNNHVEIKDINESNNYLEILVSDDIHSSDKSIKPPKLMQILMIPNVNSSNIFEKSDTNTYYRYPDPYF